MQKLEFVAHNAADAIKALEIKAKDFAKHVRDFIASKLAAFKDQDGPVKVDVVAIPRKDGGAVVSCQISSASVVPLPAVENVKAEQPAA